MKTPNRLAREVTFFLSVTAGAFVVLPVVAAALAYQSRQAMFWPAYESLYTYFLPYTVFVAVGVAVVVELVRLVVYYVRRPRL